MDNSALPTSSVHRDVWLHLLKMGHCKNWKFQFINDFNFFFRKAKQHQYSIAEIFKECPKQLKRHFIYNLKEIMHGLPNLKVNFSIASKSILTQETMLPSHLHTIDTIKHVHRYNQFTYSTYRGGIWNQHIVYAHKSFWQSCLFWKEHNKKNITNDPEATSLTWITLAITLIG